MTWYGGGTRRGRARPSPSGTLALGTTGTTGSTEYLIGRTLENFGTATETYNPSYGGDGFYVYEGATFDNESGASLTFLADIGHRDRAPGAGR